MKTNAILAFGVGCAIAVAPVGAGGESLDVGPEGLERVYYDGVDEHGNLTGGMVLLPRPDLQALMPGPGAAWTTILDNGPSSNRLDIVFVGDGYLESELGLYAGHVINGLDNLLTQEPFLSYSTYFNVHRVDVISNESGVDNDPVPGILRDTALDMGFWCNNIERLLCVNVSTAYQALDLSRGQRGLSTQEPLLRASCSVRPTPTASPSVGSYPDRRSCSAARPTR